MNASTNQPLNAAFPADQTPASKAASTLKGGIDSASGAADQAVNVIASKVDAVQTEFVPKLKDGIDQAQSLVDQSTAFVRDSAAAARDKLDDVTGQVVAYTQEEPVKALLIAAAVGAGLMALLSLMARSND